MLVQNKINASGRKPSKFKNHHKPFIGPGDDIYYFIESLQKSFELKLTVMIFHAW